MAHTRTTINDNDKYYLYVNVSRNNKSGNINRTLRHCVAAYIFVCSVCLLCAVCVRTYFFYAVTFVLLRVRNVRIVQIKIKRNRLTLAAHTPIHSLI